MIYRKVFSPLRGVFPPAVPRLAFAAVFALCACSAPGRKAETIRPNIIIIYADDLGYGDLGIYGGDIPTPNIDRIGKEGIRFTDFYVSAPACTPSRFSLLTGSYPQRSLHQLTRALMPPDTVYLDPREKTLSAYLKDEGYSTAIVGKWHLGFQDSTAMPDIHGFEQFTGFRGGCVDYFYHVYGQMGHDWYVKGKRVREEGYSTDLITNHAISFIDEVKGKTKPFFLYLPYNAPHYGKTDPDSVPEVTVSLSQSVYRGYGIINSLQAPPAYVERFAHVSDPYRRVYSAMVSSLDDNVGRLLEKLEKERLLDNTMIWFISDNGGYSETHKAHGDNGGLRGEKATLWEGGIRVPAMLLWKNRLTGGREITAPVCNVDILPTLASLLGFETRLPDRRIDGEDISKLLLTDRNSDEPGESRPGAEDGEEGAGERTIFWKYRNQTAIRKGDWKLMNGKELYNLASDRNETTDLAGRYPEKVQELQALFREIENSIQQ